MEIQMEVFALGTCLCDKDGKIIAVFQNPDDCEAVALGSL
jgi:hypothetical protein